MAREGIEVRSWEFEGEGDCRGDAEWPESTVMASGMGEAPYGFGSEPTLRISGKADTLLRPSVEGQTKTDGPR